MRGGIPRGPFPEEQTLTGGAWERQSLEAGGGPAQGDAPATRKALTEREAFDRLTLALAVAGAPALVLAWIPAWLDRHHPLDVVAATPASAPLLTLSWIALALVVMGAVWAFLLPGLLLAVRWGRANSLPMAMLLALCAAIPAWALVTQLAWGLHVAPGSAGFRGLVVATWRVAYAVGRWGSRTSALAAPWMWGRDSRWQLLVTSGAILALALLLGPRLAWQDPSSDGAHLSETTRRLIGHGTPFWGSGLRGDIAAWPGLNTVALVYPAAWQVYLLGAVDASIRIPFLLYLALVPFALIALASVRRTREPDRGVFLLAWLATLVYAVTVAFSATYDNYTVDVALPSSQDTLFVVTILAFLVGYCEAKVRLLVPALVLSLVGLPSGIQISLMWLVIATVALRPLQPKPIVATLATLVGFALAMRFLPSLLAAVGASPPGDEHSMGSLLRYYSALQVTHVGRALFVIVPGGILPALAVWRWSARDRVAAALTALAACYFAAFYVQAATQLHYYIPAMLVPVAVHLRGIADAGDRRWRVATALAAAVALALSWPRSLRPVMLLRGISHRVVIREPGYEEMTRGYFNGAHMLSALFRGAKGELSAFDGGALALQRYARRGLAIDSTTRYLVQREEDPVPLGFTVRSVRAPFALLVNASVAPEMLSQRLPPGVAAI